MLHKLKFSEEITRGYIRQLANLKLVRNCEIILQLDLDLTETAGEGFGGVILNLRN